MPKVKGLTQKERDAQAIEREIQRASQDFLNVAREKRGREDKTYAQVAEDIGVSKDTFWQWRAGKLPSAGFGRVIASYARMGYRLVPEPIAGSRKGAPG
ncbi:MAG: hypothetical protein HDT35_01200 [Clostridiales bacterium]|nr:hypothetical protein [Clostridiales bacterium]